MDIVVPNVNMFGIVMVDRVFGQKEHATVINEEGSGVRDVLL